MVVTYPSRFLIRWFHNTFTILFCYLHTFKHVNICFKINVFKIKPLYICLPDPDLRHYVQQNFIHICLKHLVNCVCSREHCPIIVKTNDMGSISSYFKTVQIPHSTACCMVFFLQNINRKNVRL